MKESKYDTLLNISIVILIVSAIMLGITGYNIFFKGKEKNPLALNASEKEAVRDSLQNVYRSTISNMDNGVLTADISVDKDAQQKLNEMSVLRGEIDSLLKQHGSEEDLAVAKIKIQELQLKVAELQNRYTNVESENRRLQALINKLISADRGAAITSTSTAPETIKTYTAEKATGGATAVIAGMHLFAVTANNKDQETNFSDEAEKIIGSFQIKSLSSKATGEVVVVVLQPDGKVIKNSVWESGTFDTHEGKKVYSRKLYFDPGDDRQLNFSLTPDKFLRGDYTMQIWYNGSLMGRVVKTLS